MPSPRAAAMPPPAPCTSVLADWMEAYVGGDARAFAQLFAVIEPRVRRQIRACVRNDEIVADLVQLTLLRAHAARGSYRRPALEPDAALVAWFCAIARNIAMSHMRAHYRERMHVRDDGASSIAIAIDDGADFESTTVRHETELGLAADLRLAIAALPASQRQVIELHKLQGLSMAEVSRRLGVRGGAVRVRAHRAYQALRAQILPSRRIPPRAAISAHAGRGTTPPARG